MPPFRLMNSASGSFSSFSILAYRSTSSRGSRPCNATPLLVLRNHRPAIKIVSHGRFHESTPLRENCGPIPGAGEACPAPLCERPLSGICSAIRTHGRASFATAGVLGENCCAATACCREVDEAAQQASVVELNGCRSGLSFWRGPPSSRGRQRHSNSLACRGSRSRRGR